MAFKFQLVNIYKYSDCFEKDVAYPGNNLNALISNDNYANGEGRRYSVGECQKLCQQTESCLFFTYSPASRSCYLKDKISEKQSRSGFVSGRKECKCKL